MEIIIFVLEAVFAQILTKLALSQKLDKKIILKNKYISEFLKLFIVVFWVGVMTFMLGVNKYVMVGGILLGIVQGLMDLLIGYQGE